MGNNEKNEKTFSRYLKDKKTIQRISEWGNVIAKMASPEGKPEALNELVVLDLSYANLAGSIAASYLAEFGAEVIKIEGPEGDPSRMITPYGEMVDGVGLCFLMENRNKYMLSLDLEKAMGQENLKKLAAKADILIETYAPGELDSLGIGYRQLKEINPKLIYIAITPYGHYTEKARQLAKIPWTDLTSQAESGLTAIIGALPDEPEPYNWPTRAGFHAASYVTATSATLGALAAVYWRELSGKGQMLDVASADAFASCVGIPVIMGYIWKRPRMRYGILDYGLCPYGFFRCKDGYIAIASFRDQDFRAALKVLGRWDLEEDWRSLLDRITDDTEKAKILDNEIAKSIANYTYDDLYQKFTSYSYKSARNKWSGGGLPVTAKLLMPEEVIKEEHWKVRKTFMEVKGEKYGSLLVPTAGKMSETPPRVKWISTEIGKDNAHIYEKYGLSD